MFSFNSGAGLNTYTSLWHHLPWSLKASSISCPHFTGALTGSQVCIWTPPSSVFLPLDGLPSWYLLFKVFSILRPSNLLLQSEAPSRDDFPSNGSLISPLLLWSCVPAWGSSFANWKLAKPGTVSNLPPLIFSNKLLGLLFASDIKWRNERRIALNSVWWRLNIF